MAPFPRRPPSDDRGWVALPVLASAGATGPTDPLAAEVMYPTAERLLQHCDAVLRLPGESRGADQDVAIARERGCVYHALEEVPGSPPDTRRRPSRPQGQEIGHVRARAGGADAARDDRIRPGLRAGRERDPRRGIRLHDVGRGAPRVPRPVEHLHGAEGRNTHLDRVPRRLLRQSWRR